MFDTHPISKGQKEYAQQIKSLSFNLKNNPEICHGLLGDFYTPATLAVMTTEQMASQEMQKQTAEMRAKAEKQSILYTSETGPRVRRTHKGEELVDDESHTPSDVPATSKRGEVKRESVGGDKVDLTARPRASEDGEQGSPSQANFDIGKVFSSVKSPTTTNQRRPSAPVLNTSGPGFDPDVDRLLEDENDSPPYSPTEENADPDVVWRGHVAMNSIGSFTAVAKHIGGFNFSSHGAWSKLMPKHMNVAGRIQQQNAIEYLCGMRYSHCTDVIVVNLEPSSPDQKEEFNALINYFVPKQRYGVIGDKVSGNVRDTYLVPVPAGDGAQPEFMLNLVDNKIPKVRAEPMLLAVFVYRSDPEQIKQSQASTILSGQPPESPTPRQPSISGPAFSPATPQQAQFPSASQTPVPIPQPPGSKAPTQPPAPAQDAQQPPAAAQPMTEAQKYKAQQDGEALGRQILGDFFSCPTVRFLTPQAYQMVPQEWEIIRAILADDERAREDLQHLGLLIEKRGRENAAKAQQAQEAQQQQGQHQTSVQA